MQGVGIFTEITVQPPKRSSGTWASHRVFEDDLPAVLEVLWCLELKGFYGLKTGDPGASWAKSGETFSRDIHVLELASSNMDNLRRLFPGEQNAVSPGQTLFIIEVGLPGVFIHLPTYLRRYTSGRPTIRRTIGPALNHVFGWNKFG